MRWFLLSEKKASPEIDKTNKELYYMQKKKKRVWERDFPSVTKK